MMCQAAGPEIWAGRAYEVPQIGGLREVCGGSIQGGGGGGGGNPHWVCRVWSWGLRLLKWASPISCYT